MFQVSSEPTFRVAFLFNYTFPSPIFIAQTTTVTDYSLRYVTIRPETTEAAQMLQEKFKKSVCRADDWKLREVQVIYHNEEASGRLVGWDGGEGCHVMGMA